MKVVAVIPARMESSRFPGKPMALIHGMPMIGHCYFRVSFCNHLDDVYVATCDSEIAEYIESIGGKAIMTADTHERASDRAAEAMLKIEQLTKEKIDILVMVQGDEPMDTPEMISDALAPMLIDHSIQVTNLVAPIESIEEFEDPNTVKVVIGPDRNAIYFSREPIPSRKKGVDDVPMQKQVCVIPFRRDYLLEFNAMPEMPLEKIESVDMLRVLESGGKVRMVEARHPSIGVDTPQHLKKVESLMTMDSLMPRYCKHSLRGDS
jgi:3-deoxy-manno-octulosonate cytidylyltransferase (CMP-KDO synthetase)